MNVIALGQPSKNCDGDSIVLARASLPPISPCFLPFHSLPLLSLGFYPLERKAHLIKVARFNR